MASLLDGPEASSTVAFPAPGQPLRAILETCTKAHAAVNQAQACIDVAGALRPHVDLQQVREVVVHTNRAVHHIVGSGSNDPEKDDPEASRETLDHSLAVAVALEDGGLHHAHSSAYARAHRLATIALWHKVHAVIDPAWDALDRQAWLDRPATEKREAWPPRRAASR